MIRERAEGYLLFSKEITIVYNFMVLFYKKIRFHKNNPCLTSADISQKLSIHRLKFLLKK